MLFTTFNLTKINLSIHFYSRSQPKFPVLTYSRFQHLSVVICVSFIMSCSDIFLCPDGVFQRSMDCTKKKKKLLLTMVPSFGKDTSLIFHFQEHTRSFNFLANALCRYCFPQVCRLWNR